MIVLFNYKSLTNFPFKLHFHLVQILDSNLSEDHEILSGHILLPFTFSYTSWDCWLHALFFSKWILSNVCISNKFIITFNSGHTFYHVSDIESEGFVYHFKLINDIKRNFWIEQPLLTFSGHINSII